MTRIINFDLLRQIVNTGELNTFSVEELEEALLLLNRNSASGHFQQGQFELLRDSIKFFLLKLSSDKRDEREERTLAIAAEANSIASRALAIAEEDLSAAKLAAKSAEQQALWAMYAAILAAVTAIIANKDIIIGLIL